MRNDGKKEKEPRLHWKRLLNYQALARQIPFFIFLALLAVIYIYNGHMADKTMRKIQRSTNDLKELRNEYKSIKGEVLLRSRQSEIAGAVKSIGLVELTTEPFVLKDSSDKKASN